MNMDRSSEMRDARLAEYDYRMPSPAQFYEGHQMADDDNYGDQEKRILGLELEEDNWYLNGEEDADDEWVIRAIGIRDAPLSESNPSESSGLVEWVHRPGHLPDLDSIGDEVFDFVHIRYQPAICSRDGHDVFRTAFNRTKPNGWIEIVEPINCPYRASNPIPQAQAITFIKQLLTRVGFVDIEVKSCTGCNGRNTASRSWQRLKGMVFGWIWGSRKGREGNAEKSERRDKEDGRERIFVIARKPC